jgi:hypothetical protein
MSGSSSENELCFLDISLELALVSSLNNVLLNIESIGSQDRAEQLYSPEPQCECS